MCDKPRQRASYLDEVCGKVRILCFLTSSFFSTLRTVSQPECGKLSTEYSFLDLWITQLMALLLSELMLENCFSYCSLTLLHDLVRKWYLMMNTHCSWENTILQRSTFDSAMKRAHSVVTKGNKGNIVYITSGCSVTNCACNIQFSLLVIFPANLQFWVSFF